MSACKLRHAPANNTLIKWICTGAIRRDLMQLASWEVEDKECEDEPVNPSPIQVHQFTKVANLSVLLIEQENRVIEFFETFDRNDPQEVKKWSEKIGEIIALIEEETEKKVNVYEYLSHGVGNYYLLDQEGVCQAFDRRKLLIDKSAAVLLAKSQIGDREKLNYFLFLPGKRELLEENKAETKRRLSFIRDFPHEKII